MGVSVYDAIALCLSERTPIKFQYCRIGSDVVCVVVGFIFGAQVGLGTVITMFFTGPLIHIFQEVLAIPLIRGRNPITCGIRKLYLTCKKSLKQRRKRLVKSWFLNFFIFPLYILYVMCYSSYRTKEGRKKRLHGTTQKIPSCCSPDTFVISGKSIISTSFSYLKGVMTYDDA